MNTEIDSKLVECFTMLRTRATVLCLGLLITCIASPALARKWTDKTGKFSIEAEFVGLADGVVTLKREDGKTVPLPLDRLSEADQQVARRLAQATSAPAAEDNPFMPSGGKTARPQPQITETAPDDKNLRTVLVEGVGTTHDEARKDAFRNAVRQVVGEVVDAETLIKNDDIVKDEVLTYSDAFVPHHKEVSEKKEGGLFRITIQATVQRRSLVMKLKAAKITVKDIDGQSLFGNVVSQLDAEQNADALVRRAMEGFPKICIEAQVAGEPKVLEKDSAKAKIQIEVQFQANKEAYKAFSTKLTRTLDAVAKDKGEFSSGVTTQTNPGARFVPRNARYQLPQIGPPFGRGQFVLRNEVIKWLPMMFEGQPNSGPPQSWKPGKFAVAISTQMTNAGGQLHWRYYDLDRGLGDLFIKAALLEGKCSVNLLDASGELVAADRFTPKCGDRTPWNASLLTLIGEGQEGMSSTVEIMNPPMMDNLPAQTEKMHLVLIAPLFLWQSGGRHAPTLTVPVEMSLSHDEVKRVTKAKCELSYNDK